MRICFVCLGNICRSPTAEGVFKKLVTDAQLDGKLTIDSAGTGAWHVGELPDPRSRSAASRRGYDLSTRARRFVAADFDRFDLVLAMDRDNYENLQTLARGPGSLASLGPVAREPRSNPNPNPPNAGGRTNLPPIRLLRSFDESAPIDAEVPDPWYGDGDGFEEVLDICERACRGLLDHVRSRV